MVGQFVGANPRVRPRAGGVFGFVLRFCGWFGDGFAFFRFAIFPWGVSPRGAHMGTPLRVVIATNRGGWL